jgi:hypothetical protein
VIRETREHDRLADLEDLLPQAAGLLLEAAGEKAHEVAEKTRRLQTYAAAVDTW